ncbi:MAG: endonuclease/exonuclease/phosphatase family protein [Candidatus Microthrix sp.]|uniref:Endonuclease/exonuclease/phosphatase family protein n=1 Tax=Candidatus Neomicrothrix subdominans TaxID=2954438 RepID=A0A936N9G4_9ACTN|nr:endonuclease/exonuclease/phosphatase family protein [Candidatus Microthrix subdominans]
MPARILTWNLERTQPLRGRGSAAVDHVFSLAPDIAVLTETRITFPKRGGHTLWSKPPRKPRHDADERTVLAWSRQPFSDVDHAGAPGLDTSRFVAATTETPIGPIRVLAVCIPWHMAEVTYPIDVKRRPWELHLDYLAILADMIAGVTVPTIVVGDFNQRIPRVRYGNHRAAQALAAAFQPLQIVTEGVLKGVSRPGIDHIALSDHLQAQTVWGWPNQVDGRRLSDHDGSGVDIGLAPARPTTLPRSVEP